MNRKPILAAFVLMLTLAAAFVAGRAHAAQPHMASARGHLRAARAQLQEAVSNKGGHKERAITLVDQAIGEVDAGMEFSREH